MNLFILDRDPLIAAHYHCNKHMKMIVETAQLLSTAHRVLDGEQYIELSASNRKIKRWRLANPELDSILYTATHYNHPCAIWVRDSTENYLWAYFLLKGLLDEYTYRYGKTHKTESLIPFLCWHPVNIKSRPMTTFAQAMPIQYRQDDAVQAYRDYYRLDKAKNIQMVWTKRGPPSWMNS